MAEVSLCEASDFAPGPMALLVDQIVENDWGYSILASEAVRFVSESQVTADAGALKAAKKAIRLPGAKMPKETRYFFNTGRLLARIARKLETDEKSEVIAVLFRDSDGTASAGRGLWKDKRNSMLDGFGEEGYTRGVPMIPKPKSEAWLICALKEEPYRNCDALEDRSGNDSSPNSLKKELAEILESEDVDRELLVQVFEDQGMRFDRINMPSFKAFLDALRKAMGVAELP